MGIVLVALWAITAVVAFGTTMTSTWRRITSSTRVANRSRFPSAQRHSMAMVCPSTQPCSRSACRNATKVGLGSVGGGKVILSTAIRGTCPGRCAAATQRERESGEDNDHHCEMRCSPCDVTSHRPLLLKPNFVFDDSPSYGIASAILLRRSGGEHAFQRCLTTLCSQAPACAMQMRPMVIKHCPMMSLTTESCQAPLGTIFHDSRHGAVPGSSPRDVVKHTRQQVLADRVPSSIRIGGLL